VWQYYENCKSIIRDFIDPFQYNRFQLCNMSWHVCSTLDIKQITRIYTYVANQQMHPDKMWFITVHSLVCYMRVNIS